MYIMHSIRQQVEKDFIFYIYTYCQFVYTCIMICRLDGYYLHSMNVLVDLLVKYD